jgi:tartrate dehydrogenase/decarboxylase/D-malate dehydrogenase
VIVRENSEGEYAGVGGRVHKGLPEEVATDVSMFTRAGVTRIIRFAFEVARSRHHRGYFFVVVPDTNQLADLSEQRGTSASTPSGPPL